MILMNIAGMLIGRKGQPRHPRTEKPVPDLQSKDHGDRRGTKAFASLIEAHEKRAPLLPQTPEVKKMPDLQTIPLAEIRRTEKAALLDRTQSSPDDSEKDDPASVNEEKEEDEPELVTSPPLAGPQQKPLPQIIKTIDSKRDESPSGDDAHQATSQMQATKLEPAQPAAKAAAAEPRPQKMDRRPQEAEIVDLRTFQVPVSNVPLPDSASAAPDPVQSYGSIEPPVSFTVSVVTKPPEMRLLKIKLHPDHLGELTVSLKLKGSELAVKIETHSGAALEVVRKDEGLLRQVLQSAGYDAPTLTVSVAPFARDAPSLMPVLPADPSSSLMQSTLSGGQGSGEGAPPGNGGGNLDFAKHEEEWREIDDDTNAAPFVRRRVDGIFL